MSLTMKNKTSFEDYTQVLILLKEQTHQLQLLVLSEPTLQLQLLVLPEPTLQLQLLVLLEPTLHSDLLHTEQIKQYQKVKTKFLKP